MPYLVEGCLEINEYNMRVLGSNLPKNINFVVFFCCFFFFFFLLLSYFSLSVLISKLMEKIYRGFACLIRPRNICDPP